MRTSTLRTSGEDRPRLSLIRGFELRDGATAVHVPMSAQRLVAFVALQHGAVSRPFASGILWSDASEARAGASLRSALWRTPCVAGQHLVQASATHLWLNPAVEVDLRCVVTRGVELIGGSGADRGALELTNDLLMFGGDLLPEWYEDWVLVERERFRQLRLHALEAMCERLADEGRYALALQAGLAAVACEPLRESAQRQVIRVHLMEGNIVEAVRQYRAYVTLLDRELAARPSASLNRLFEVTLGSAPDGPWAVARSRPRGSRLLSRSVS